MAVCTTCYEAGIRAGEHDCPGPQYTDIVFTRHQGQGITVNTAPPRTRIALQAFADRYAYLHMPTPDTIVFADQVVYQVTGYADGALELELIEDWRSKPGAVLPVEGNPAAAAEALRQMDADPHGLKAGMIVQSYREYGQEKWVFRCWGTDDGCDGYLSLDHTSQQGAERARDRHAAEDHTNQPTEKTMPTCTATIQGPHVLDGGPITCTREAGHPENHVGSNPEGDGRTLWTDHTAGATPHQTSSEEQPDA